MIVVENLEIGMYSSQLGLKKISAWFQLQNCSAPARLGSEHSKLGLARAGKFKLELISNIHYLGLTQ